MRYSGKFGYSVQTEVSPGVWEDVIAERDTLGRVEQRTEKLSGESDILPRYSTTTSISVLSRGPAVPENGDLVYVTWRGRRWAPGSIVEEYPGLKIFIGEEYHGPLPPGAPDTP